MLLERTVPKNNFGDGPFPYILTSRTFYNYEERVFMACNVYQKNNKTSVIYIYKATSVLRQEMETDSNPIFWKKWHFHTEITKPQRQIMKSLEVKPQT